MVTGRHIVGMMASGLGSGEGGKAAAAIVREAEALDWNAWFSHGGGAQTAQGERLCGSGPGPGLRAWPAGGFRVESYALRHRSRLMPIIHKRDT